MSTPESTPSAFVASSAEHDISYPLSCPPRIAVLASGHGTNLQALIDAIESGHLFAQIALVISNHAGAPALDRAAAHGLPMRLIPRNAYSSREAQQAALLAALQEAQVSLVVLAGFDRILDASIVSAFPQRILNIHPSLLPAFAGGMAPRPQADALAYGVKISGCTVHLVTEEIDAGPIIAQASVPVLEGDTVEALSARILEQEHRLLPLAVNQLLVGRVQIEGRRASILA
ncbi:MAG TPA: phosphoribosylglycinamide formyltransferase [Ktedonobacterales bacterium]|nr:phosphoribosylglycinamide formyltransferase [Ktedonobacterales bacterium]